MSKSPFVSGSWGSQLTDIGRRMSNDQACRLATDDNLEQLLVFLDDWRDAVIREQAARLEIRPEPVPVPDAGTAELDKATAAKITSLHGGDQECGHSLADKILVELLDLLGFRETTKAFIELPKWYA